MQQGSKDDSVVQLVLIRHGESELNSSNVFCGWLDAKLTGRGREQAAGAGRQLVELGLKPSKLYTSRLVRNVQTGDIIMLAMRRDWCDVRRSWRLNERHYGLLQGCNKDEVRARFGQARYDEWRRGFDGRPPSAGQLPPADVGFLRELKTHCALREDYERYGFAVPDGESLHMVVDRVAPLVAELKHDLLEHRCVLLVGHGSTIRALLRIFLDAPIVEIPNCEPILLEFDRATFACTRRAL